MLNQGTDSTITSEPESQPVIEETPEQVNENVPVEPIGEDRYMTDSYMREVLSRIERRLENKGLSETIAAHGFRILPNERNIVIPENMLKHDATVEELVVVSKFFTKHQVATYESEDNFAVKPEADNFLLGLLYCFEKPAYCKFTASKKPRDLGFAVGMSFRLRGWAENRNQIAALRPNNFFFGNNPGEVQVIAKKKIGVEYSAKQLIIDCFVSAKSGDMFARLISYALKTIALDSKTLSDQDGDKLLKVNIKGFDTMIQKGWAPIYSKKGKVKTLEGYKRATMPNRNSLFLKEEMLTVTQCMSPFFSSLESIKLHYHELIYRDGYPALEKLVTDEYHIRHEILARFSAVTTKRLQDIRRLPEVIKTLKKKEVTAAQVALLLSKRDDPVQSFLDEISQIVTPSRFARAMTGYSEKNGVLSKNSVDTIISKTITCYIHNKIYGDKKAPIAKTVLPETDYIKFFESIARQNNKLTGNCLSVTNLLRKFDKAETPEQRGLIRTQLAPYIRELKRVASDLLEVDYSILEKVLFLGWWNKDTIGKEFLTEIMRLCDTLDDVTSRVTEYSTLRRKLDIEVKAQYKRALEQWTASGASKLI
jgi:hypothetical protein